MSKFSKAQCIGVGAYITTGCLNVKCRKKTFMTKGEQKNGLQINYSTKRVQYYLRNIKTWVMKPIFNHGPISQQRRNAISIFRIDSDSVRRTKEICGRRNLKDEKSLILKSK